MKDGTIREQYPLPQPIPVITGTQPCILRWEGLPQPLQQKACQGKKVHHVGKLYLVEEATHFLRVLKTQSIILAVQVSVNERTARLITHHLQ